MKIGTSFPFLIMAAAIVIGFSIPFSPWIRSDVIEEARVITSDGDRCVVETESNNIIHIDNCLGKEVGELVTVKYKVETSVGEIIP